MEIMVNQELCRDAAEDAIEKHLSIIDDLKTIVALKYATFRIVNNETEEEITGLKLTDFINFNIQEKTNRIKDYEQDIKTCYSQMEVFKL